MEVILLKDVEDIGRKGECVRIRDGFGRNFLLPQNLALIATKANRKFVEELRAKAEKRYAEERKTAQTMAEKVQSLKLTFERAVGEGEKLFGSVTNEDIRESLEKQNFLFRKKQIQLKDPIRSVGVHPVPVEVYPQVKATLSVEVVPQKQ